MNIGSRIKVRRKELGLSADELAEKLGKDRATIYRYENGDIENLPLSILEPIAVALQTKPGYLMGWDNYLGTKLEESAAESREALERLLEKDELQLITDYRRSATEDKKLILRTAANAALAASALPVEKRNTAKAVAEDWLEGEARAANLPEDTPEAVQE